MQSALGKGDREGNIFCANLEDRDKETEVLGGALLMLDIGADFPLGPKFSQGRKNVAFRSMSRMQSGPNSGLPNSESGMADGRWRVPHRLITFL